MAHSGTTYHDIRYKTSEGEVERRDGGNPLLDRVADVRPVGSEPAAPLLSSVTSTQPRTLFHERAPTPISRDSLATLSELDPIPLVPDRDRPLVYRLS